MKNSQVLFTVGITSLILSVVFVIISFFLNKNIETVIIKEQTIPVEFSSPVKSNYFDFSVASEKATKAVVHIKSSIEKSKQENSRMEFNPFDFDPFGGGWGFFDMPRQPSSGMGSGVIISDNGYIITNSHVVQGFDKFDVTLSDSRLYEAELVGKDPSTDIAVLKIEEKNLNYLNFSNSDVVKVGQWVLAVGNPLDLKSTVTSGIISAKARNINILRGEKFSVESFLQTDAAVNQGNSGGALVDIYGNLVGINTAIASRSGGYEGYSFAVPSNIASKVSSDLIEYGAVQRALLGVFIQELNPEVCERLKIDKNTRGIYISGYTSNSTAEKNGIKEGDVMQKIDGININTIPQLQEKLMQKNPGEFINVDVLRNGKIKTLKVKLMSLQEATEVMQKS